VPARRPTLAKLLELSLVLGVTAFGGGFALVQRMKRAVVDDKKWIDDAAFVETLSVASALPGAASTNLVAMLGMRFVGLAGAALAVAVFLAPSVLLILAFGVFYERMRSLGGLGAFLDGMSLATVGVVAAVAFDIRRTAVKNVPGWLLAASATAALVTHLLHLVEVVGIAGFVGAIAMRPKAGPPSVPPPPSASLFVPFVWATASSTVVLLFLVFARVGVATFGGGFAMVTPLYREAVETRGWLTPSAFNDAMVLGQITPGPVAVAATFIGYRVGGLAGAAASTIGMFAPPFVLAALAARSLAAFRSSAIVQGILAGIAPAVVGIIAASAVALYRAAVHDGVGAAVAVATFLVLAHFRRLSPLVPLAVGGVVALGLHYVREGR
jgi:chromate transporter